MEEKKETDEGLFKVRGYLGCLSEGAKLATRNFISLLKFLYPSLIIGILVAICGVSGFSFMMKCRADADIFGWLAMVNAFVLLCYVAISFYWGQFAVAVSHYVRTTGLSLPSVRVYCKEVTAAFGRACRVFAPWCIFFMCVVSACIWVWSAGFASWTGWVAVSVAVLLWLLLFVPYQAVVGDYLLGGEHGLGKSMACMKDGYRRWGAFFVLLLCGGGLSWVAALIGGMPFAVLLMAWAQAFGAEMAGDVTDLPSYFSVLTVVCAALASLVAMVGAWLMMFPLAFFYGSIETGKKEKEKFEEEERLFR